ncbi:MAG: zinc-binding dehydrogenase [Chloroflexi bacterium]|nr:MAG: zinc-binding dehydrogenase [Chloroflexota bacterium]TME15495.1 MAG: zinc-binding dehydrogenase [Chloroflexota bacterium]
MVGEPQWREVVKALVWLGPERMEVREVDEPRPGPGEVVVKTEAAGICGSEVEGYLGRMANRKPPLVMGHEYAGAVSEVGEAVDRAWRGRRVAVNPIVGCGRCRYCTSGDRNLCPDRHLVGIGVPGGFAVASVVPERCLFALPDGMDARLGALVEPLANGVHAMRQLAGKPGRVAVIGAGTIGLACVQAALLNGVEVVTVVERHAKRREQALGLGAHEAFEDLSSVKPGQDVVVDAVGAEATRVGAVELLGPAGTAVFIGLHEDESALPWHRVIRANIRVQGTFGYADRDFQQALDWLAAGKAVLPLSPIRPLTEGPAAFSALAAGPLDEIKVFLG